MFFRRNLKLKSLMLVIVFTFTFLCGCKNEATQLPELNKTPERVYSGNDLKTFDEYTDRLLKEMITDNAVNLHFYTRYPEKFGISDYDVTLGKYDLENIDDFSEIIADMNTLKTFNYNELSKSQQITYDILMQNFETSLNYSDLYLYGNELTPYTGTNVTLPTLFSEFPIYSKKDVEDYIALLEDTPRYYHEIIEYTKLQAKNNLLMSDVTIDAIIKQCQEFIKNNKNEDNFLVTSFDKKLDAMPDLSAEEKNFYKARNKIAVNDIFIPAYNILIDELSLLKGSGRYHGGLSNFPNGKKYYEYLAARSLGWNKSIEDLDALLDQYIKSAYFKMTSITNADPSVITKFEDFDFTISTAPDGLRDLKDKISKDFPSGPDINYTIKTVDKSLEKNANPAMYFISQIDNFKENSIYINEAQQNKDSLYPTLAHEGFPGHMYQMTYFANTNPNPIRLLYRPDGYMEGWATYCELYSYAFDDNYNSNPKLFETAKANSQVILALQARMDIGINYYGWSKNELKKFMNEWGLNATDDTVKNVYDYLVAEPCEYIKYACGCFAFMEFSTYAKGALGDKFDIKAFHKFILDLGPVSFDILETRLNEWINEQKNN